MYTFFTSYSGNLHDILLHKDNIVLECTQSCAFLNAFLYIDLFVDIFQSSSVAPRGVAASEFTPL